MSINKNEKYQNFIAGLVAGFVSVTVCNPLDITRTRLNIMVLNKKLYFRILQVTNFKNILDLYIQWQQSLNKKA